MNAFTDSEDWREDCLKWRGVVLTGRHAHWCPDWDFLPIDETSREWPCACCRDNACGTFVEVQPQQPPATWQLFVDAIREFFCLPTRHSDEVLHLYVMSLLPAPRAG